MLNLVIYPFDAAAAACKVRSRIQYIAGAWVAQKSRLYKFKSLRDRIYRTHRLSHIVDACVCVYIHLRINLFNFTITLISNISIFRYLAREETPIASLAYVYSLMHTHTCNEPMDDWNVILKSRIVEDG